MSVVADELSRRVSRGRLCYTLFYENTLIAFSARWAFSFYMKTVFAIFAFVTAFVAQLCAGDAKPDKTKPAVKEVPVDEAEKLIANTSDLIVLDVRIPEEFEHEHIKGAVNVNVFDVDFERLVAALDQTKPVLVHCASGRRSTKAITQMTGKVKFPQIYHMNEGFSAWKAAKKPFVGKPLPKEFKGAPPK